MNTRALLFAAAVGCVSPYAAYEAEQGAIAKAPGLSARLTALAEKDADYLDNWRSIIAVHRPDGSFGKMQGTDHAKVRGWRITTTRVRAFMSDDERRTLDDLYQAAVLTSETNIYAVSPKQSHMPATYSADPFWKSNPVFAAAAAKSGAVQAGAPKEVKRSPQP